MTAVTVTSPIGVTCHYWLQPQAAVSLTGSGVVIPNIVHGQLSANIDGSPATLSLALDDSFLWDVILEFRGAAPIIFEGFAPANGDLLTLLTAQGWCPS